MTQVTFKQKPVTLVGKQVQVGDKAPDFRVLANDLTEVTLADFKGKVKLISVIPSIDTGVCDAQTRRFNEEAATLNNTVVLTISVDLPFAQRRWCAAEGIDEVKTLSDHKEVDFGQAYGVLIDELRLLARSVFVVNEEDEVIYAQYVNEVSEHPDYDAALTAIKDRS
ncbi:MULTISPECIES: thiol peroxidase [Bacillaceae]|uniref:Thiol peroxidase n=2 Tax=Bacillaceae TaxID=186817 RepID=A0A9D5I1A3_9BACI|nr:MULTISPECIES: thiol peroxidase [Bacillaceae]KQL57474.1 peroxidase [Alkalicoccobacillus plakortidis]MBG9783899.1 peroxidase [Shouchella lehensis]RQW21112.1 thiol peroxidase [Bacillus sp. C1-1]TES51137.1 thiol peroxidase [Shouchella lehensis]